MKKICLCKIRTMWHDIGEDNDTSLQYSCLAWKIPWMEEPSRLPSMGSHRVGSRRVGHDWAISLSLFTFMHWRLKWQPTPVFLSGESQGQGNLVGFHQWGHTEWDTTEATKQQQQQWHDIQKIYINHGLFLMRI